MYGTTFPKKLALSLSLLCALHAGAQSARAGAPGGEVPAGRAVVLLAGSSKERLGTAAALFLKGEWDLLLLANDGVLGGWSRPHQRNLYNVERSEEALLRYGVPARAIVKLPFSRSGTIYDALAARGYHRQHPLRAIALVTSDYHAPRARWSFEKVFEKERVPIEVCPVKTRPRTPRETVAELAKTWWYYLRYGLFSTS